MSMKFLSVKKDTLFFKDFSSSPVNVSADQTYNAQRELDSKFHGGSVRYI